MINEKGQGEECSKIQIDEINEFLKGKIYFKCKHSLDFIKSPFDINSQNEQFINVFV